MRLRDRLPNYDPIPTAGTISDVTQIINSKGNTWDADFDNIQTAIDDLGNLGREDGGVVPAGTNFYVPSSKRAWVKLAGGVDYTGDEQILINPFVQLYMGGSRLIITDAYDAVKMSLGSGIYDGTITAAKEAGGPDAYTNALILIEDNPILRLDQRTNIENMYLQGDHIDPGYAVPWKGTGIYLHVDDAATGNIFNVNARNILMERMEYGIHMLHEGTVAHMNSMNNNIFDNVWINGAKHGVYMDITVDDHSVAPIDGNFFRNLVYQTSTHWNATYGYPDPAIHIEGASNIFSNMCIWDWLTMGHTLGINAVEFTAASIACYLESRGLGIAPYTGAHWWVSDLGTQNTVWNLGRPRMQPTASTNWGNVSIGDGATIDHLLGEAPSSVSLVGSLATEYCTATAVDATHITVAIKKRTDGSAGTAQTVYWQAKV